MWRLANSPAIRRTSTFTCTSTRTIPTVDRRRAGPPCAVSWPISSLYKPVRLRRGECTDEVPRAYPMARPIVPIQVYEMNVEHLHPAISNQVGLCSKERSVDRADAHLIYTGCAGTGLRCLSSSCRRSWTSSWSFSFSRRSRSTAFRNA